MVSQVRAQKTVDRGRGILRMVAVGVALAVIAAPAFPQALPSDRLCTAGFNTDYGWFDVGMGTLGVLEFPGLLAQNVCVPNAFTSAALAIQLGGLTLPLAEQVSYGYSSAIGVALAEPALCEDYFTGGAGESVWSLGIVDANGEAMIQNLRGVASLAYNYNAHALVPAMVASYGSTPWLRCHSGLAPNVDLHPDTPADPSAIFANGFEGPSVWSNLQVEFLTAAGDAPLAGDAIDQTAGTSVAFTLRIANVGNGAAQNVRVREFVPSSAALLMPTVQRIACIDRGATGTGNTACSSGIGATPLRESIGTLAAGAHRDFVLTRRSSGLDSSQNQSLALIQAAAFAAPDGNVETAHADNSRALRIRIVTVE